MFMDVHGLWMLMVIPVKQFKLSNSLINKHANTSQLNNQLTKQSIKKPTDRPTSLIDLTKNDQPDQPLPSSLPVGVTIHKLIAEFLKSPIYMAGIGTLLIGTGTFLHEGENLAFLAMIPLHRSNVNQSS